MDTSCYSWGIRIPGSGVGCVPASIPIVVPACNTCGEAPVTPPTNIVAPSITGTPVVGNTLTANPGTWMPSQGISYSYQWQADGVDIPGATGQTYLPTPGDEGMTLTVVVTATNIAGADDAESNAVTILAAPVNTVLPVISGTPEAGETLSVDTGTWTGTAPITYTYQWLADGTPISGATATTFLVTTAQNGAAITVEVTGTNTVGADTVETLPVTIEFAPENTAAPVVSGTPEVGQTLSVTNGTWIGTAPITYTYQWKRDGVDIVGATSATYELVLADDGTEISAEVTATNAQGSDSALSNSVEVGTAPVNTVLPTISGTPVEGQTLTASNGTWTGSAPITYTYQWLNNGTPISGETASTYVVRVGDAGDDISVTVTGTNNIGSSSATSADTEIAVAPVNTAIPVISGTLEVGETLTASTGTWTGTAPITYTYQWKRNGVDIPGATGATYVAQAADVD